MTRNRILEHDRCWLESAICLLAHVLTGSLLGFGLFSGTGAWMFFSLVPWAYALDKGGPVATFVGSTFAGTMIGLIGYEVVLMHPYPWALIRAVWVLGAILFSGLNWMSGTLVARWLIRKKRSRLLSMLVGWFTFDVCLRYLCAGVIDGGLPFLQIGASQHHYPIIQIASVAGLTGVGVFVVVVNCLVLNLVAGVLSRSPKDRRAAVIPFLLAGSVVLVASLDNSTPEGAGVLKVGVLNVPLAHEHQDMLPANELLGLDLVVLGEGGFLVAKPNIIMMPKISPGDEDSESGPANVLWGISKRLNAPIIVGAERWWECDGPFRFNSVVLTTPDSGVHQAYDKMWLTPEHEARPRFLRFTDRLLGSETKITYQWGTPSEPFLLPRSGVRIGMSICYDLYFDQPFYNYTSGSLDPIDLIVNCAGHEELGERIDALAMRHARFRAVESGCPIVHVVIGGTSCGYDAWGNQLFQVENHDANGDLRVVEIPLARRDTLYGQMGRFIFDVVLASVLFASACICRVR